MDMYRHDRYNMQCQSIDDLQVADEECWSFLSRPPEILRQHGPGKLSGLTLFALRRLLTTLYTFHPRNVCFAFLQYTHYARNRQTICAGILAMHRIQITREQRQANIPITVTGVPFNSAQRCIPAYMDANACQDPMGRCACSKT